MNNPEIAVLPNNSMQLTALRAVLMAAALKLAKLRLDASTKGSVIIKAEAQKQHALRAN